MKKNILLIFATILFLFGASQNALATTYYVSTSGSDSNNGTSKTTPWAHVPGMPTATSTAGGYSAVAGDSFILKGCDVWYNTAGTSNFPLVLQHGGSSGNPVTFGVDQTWYNTTNCPSAWNRPVFDARTSSGSSTPTQIGGSTSGCVGGNGNNFILFNDSYITFNWIELRNLYYSNDAGGTCFKGNGWFQFNSVDYITISNSYEHDWKMGTSGGVTDTDQLAFINGSPECPHCLLTKNVVSNCATTPSGGPYPGGALSITNTTYSTFECMSNAYKPYYAGEFGFNNISWVGESPDTSIHSNCIESVGASGNGGIYYIHDNRIHDNPSCEGLQIGNPGEIDYVWNNIWYNPLGIGANGPQVPQAETPISFHFWNNIIVDWSDCINDASHGYTWSGAFYSQNNHCINAGGSNSSGSPTASPVVISNNLGMTDTVATADGYTNSQAFVYSPTSISSPTVGAGVNLTSLWPAGFATLDSSIVCTKQTVSTVVQSVCTGTQHVRPATGAWDIGAYEYNSSGIPAPAPASISPTSDLRSYTGNVTVTGTAFDVGGTSTLSFSGTGVTVNSYGTRNATTLTANITITSGAALTARDVTITNADAQTGTLAGAFTVTLPAPSPVSLSPPTIAQGVTGNVTVTGTDFDTGGTSTLSFSGTGITINSYGTRNATTLIANITVSGVAALTARDVIVTNSDAQTGTLAAAFTVTAPVLTLVSIAVTPTSPSIALGLTQQFTAIGTYSDASTANITSTVTWASATPSVATIAAGGLATSIAGGTTNITASLSAITSNTAVLTVTLFSISGNAGIAGATISWTGTSSGSTTADGSGNYTIPSLTLGAYTITPSLSGYHFSPTGQGETISSASITGASFTAAGNLPPPTPPKPIIPLPFTKRMTAAADVFRCIGITSPQGILRTLDPDVPTVAALQLEYTQLLVNYQILIRQDVPSQQTVLFAAINNAVTIVGRLKATLQSMTARGDNAIVLAGLQSVVENALTSLQTVVASE